MDSYAESLKAVPAHIFIGSHLVSSKMVQEQLQRFFCPKKGCGACHVCSQLSEKQFHAVRWIVPDKHYKVEHVNEIIAASSFILAENQHFFFVLERAELLSHACANRLLKLLEEPPMGYHFILQVEHEEAILDTIKSRCFVTRCHDVQYEIVYKELYDVFTFAREAVSASDLIKMMERHVPDEVASKFLFEQIVAFWCNQKKQKNPDVCMYNDDLIDQMIFVLQSCVCTLPVTGGARLFWMNLFLKVFEKQG